MLIHDLDDLGYHHDVGRRHFGGALRSTVSQVLVHVNLYTEILFMSDITHLVV